MRRTRLAFIVALPVLLAAACGGGASPGISSGGGGSARSSHSDAVPAQAAIGAAPQSGPAKVAPVPVPAPLPNVPSDKLIRTASVTLEVRSGRFDESLRRLEAMTAQQGGFVSASTASTTDDRLREGVFTFSVPSDRFEATMAALRDLGTVKAERTSSQDVAAQYVDLQARLRNAEAQRDAMLALLGQAKSVNEIIAVQTQLGQITAQVEQLKGQINYLDHATAYSTVTVTLREAGAPVAPPSDLLSLRDALRQGLHAFLGSLAFLLLLLAAVGPYVLVAAGGLIAWRLRRARTA